MGWKRRKGRKGKIGSLKREKNRGAIVKGKGK